MAVDHIVAIVVLVVAGRSVSSFVIDPFLVSESFVVSEKLQTGFQESELQRDPNPFSGQIVLVGA